MIEIFENNLLPQVLPISLATMEIMRDDEQEELAFLYRYEISKLLNKYSYNNTFFVFSLVPGRSTSSWGTFCAVLAGVPSHVVKRGKIIFYNLNV